MSSAAEVCCPSCWLWSPRGQTKCRHCGTTLVHITGQDADKLPEGEVKIPAYLSGQTSVAQQAKDLQVATAGTNWLSIARYITVGEALLLAGGLLLAAVSLKTVPGFMYQVPGMASTLTVASLQRTLTGEAAGLMVGTLINAWLLRFRIWQILAVIGNGLGLLGLFGLFALPKGGGGIAYQSAVVALLVMQLVYVFVLVRLSSAPKPVRASPYG